LPGDAGPPGYRNGGIDGRTPAYDYVVMSEQDPPVPPEAWKRAARVAQALEDIETHDRDAFDALLAYFLRICWPTLKIQAQ
jgi:hypothetical protein